ncbi:hypothetical protein MRB53_012452 [Persea americana]|uniref:Uncharacterized protein n=1 Tax=Persea americana TaxID=3435 RepID=A0ACC2LXV2_PERAE|nr:hypothetical protein MRB53_012452 [Persea americana]
MAPIAVGDKIPEGSLAYMDSEKGLQVVSVYSLAAGKKHVPGFIEKSEELKSKGIDDILLISVNDPFVMKAWEKNYPESKNIKFLADGSATYAHALGLELDLSDKGLGDSLLEGSHYW